MREDIDPVRWAGQRGVVALPQHVDTSNACQIREELLSGINGSATALIVDMTGRTSCGHSGADAVVRAFQRVVYRRHRVAAGGHRPARLADAQLQRPGPFDFHLPVPGSGYRRRQVQRWRLPWWPGRGLCGSGSWWEASSGMGDSDVRELIGPPRHAGGPLFDMVVSKLRRPLVPPGTVGRPLLVGRLAQGDPRPIVSVVAPPGYGKTTLLSQLGRA